MFRQIQGWEREEDICTLAPTDNHVLLLTKSGKNERKPCSDIYCSIVVQNITIKWDHFVSREIFWEPFMDLSRENRKM